MALYSNGSLYSYKITKKLQGNAENCHLCKVFCILLARRYVVYWHLRISFFVLLSSQRFCWSTRRSSSYNYWLFQTCVFIYVITSCWLFILFLPLITITSNLVQSDCYINWFLLKKGAIILTSTVKNGRYINLYIYTGASIKDEYACEHGRRSKFCVCLLFKMCDRRTHIYLSYGRSLEYIVDCISSIKE